MNPDKQSLLLFLSLSLLTASVVWLVNLWRQALWYRKTRKETDRYLAHLRQAVEDNDEVSFRRWEARLTEVLEYAKERLGRM